MLQAGQYRDSKTGIIQTEAADWVDQLGEGKSPGLAIDAVIDSLADNQVEFVNKEFPKVDSYKYKKTNLSPDEMLDQASPDAIEAAILDAAIENVQDKPYIETFAEGLVEEADLEEMSKHDIDSATEILTDFQSHQNITDEEVAPFLSRLQAGEKPDDVISDFFENFGSIKDIASKLQA